MLILSFVHFDNARNGDICTLHNIRLADPMHSLISLFVLAIVLFGKNALYLSMFLDFRHATAGKVTRKSHKTFWNANRSNSQIKIKNIIQKAAIKFMLTSNIRYFDKSFSNSQGNCGIHIIHASLASDI